MTLLVACQGGSTAPSSTTNTPTSAPTSPNTPEPTSSEEPTTSEERTSEEEALDFYADQAVTILVGVNPGGAVDTSARFWAEWLPKYLEGSPAFVIENMPGGSHRIAMNYYDLQVPRDGLTLMLGSPSGHSNWRFGVDGVDYDLTGWEPLIGSPGANAWYASPDAVASIEELVAGNHDELIFAGQQPFGGDLYKYLAWMLLDIETRVVWGYGGRGPSHIAFEQGEANIGVQSVPVYLESVEPLVESGDAILLFSMGMLTGDGALVRDDFWTDLPHVGEIYEMIHGTEPSGPFYDAMVAMAGVQDALGRVLYIHGDAPEPALEALRDAIERMASDPEFLEASSQTLGPFNTVIGQELRDLVRVSLVDVEPDVIEFIVDFVEEEWGIDVRTAEG